MPEVRIDVIANTHGAPAQLQQTETALAGIERQGVATDASLGGVWKQMAAGVIAAGLVERGVRAFTSACIDSVKAAIEAERVDRALEAALEITGRAAVGVSLGLSNYASALQKKTVYDDEAIKSAQALIIQMRGTTDGLHAATRGAIGLASVFGMDLQSAARSVAQGMEGNYIMLGRLIPAIREAKTETEKHSAMMEALAGFYKRAEADAETFGGKLDQLKGAYNNLQESIGNFVTKNKDVIDTLSGVKEIIIWLDRNVQKLDEKKGFKWLDITAPGALLKIVRDIGGEAKKANDAYAASWEGITLAVLEASPPIDALPTIILDTSASTKKATADFIALSRAIQVAHSAAKAIEPIPFKLFGDFEPAKLVYQLTQLPPPLMRIQEILDAIGGKNPLLVLQEEADRTKAKFEDLVQAAGQIFSSFNAVSAQAQRNREIAVDNEYKRRLAAINANVKDEEARQKAIVALEAEYQVKKTEAQRAGAKASKAVSMMEAVVNTASAITSALKVFPPWLGISFASIVGALGAIQVGLIAKQPIPLAKGGYFKEETVLNGYRLADNPGHEEIVSPVPMMRKIIRDELLALSSYGGGTVTVNFSGPLVEAHGWSESELMRAPDIIVRAVNKGLRDLGHRTI